MKNMLAFALLAAINFLATPDGVAQQRSPVGEYQLEGFAEVVSKLIIHEGDSFEIFFKHQLTKKYGKGTWVQEGDRIILNTVKRPDSDFKLMSTGNAGRGIALRIVDPIDSLFLVFKARFVNEQTDTIIKSNLDGIILTPIPKADSIGLWHTYMSDRVCYFDVSAATGNFFNFSVEPAIHGIYCDQLSMLIYYDFLEGKHPLLDPEKNYVFRKVQ
jgi:hypothetical protein